MIIPNIKEIQKRREALGMTRCGLSRKAGLSANAIYRIENGESSFVHPIRAKAIAEALGCPLTDVFVVEGKNQIDMDREAEASPNHYNKDLFLASDFGQGMKKTIADWDYLLSMNSNTALGMPDANMLIRLTYCQAQWKVYQAAIKHFYGIEYHFTRADKYFGICTEDESDWLMKEKRKR